MELRNNVLRMRSKFFSNFEGQDIKAMPIAKRTGLKAQKSILVQLLPSNLSTHWITGLSSSCFSRASQIFSQVPSPLSTLKYVMVVPSIVVVSLNQGTILHRRPGEGCYLAQVASEEGREDRGAVLAALCTIGPPTSSESGQREMTASAALAGACPVLPCSRDRYAGL